MTDYSQHVKAKYREESSDKVQCIRTSNKHNILDEAQQEKSVDVHMSDNH